MEAVISGVRENNLKLTLAFGIGLHHAGLHEQDRKVAEELFVNQKIQVSAVLIVCRWTLGKYSQCSVVPENKGWILDVDLQLSVLWMWSLVFGDPTAWTYASCLSVSACVGLSPSHTGS